MAIRMLFLDSTSPASMKNIEVSDDQVFYCGVNYSWCLASGKESICCC